MSYSGVTDSSYEISVDVFVGKSAIKRRSARMKFERGLQDATMV